MSKIFLKLINFYQNYLSFDSGILMFLAPGGACRHNIRCSEYTKVQIKEKGALAGLFLGLKRVLLCS